MANLYGYSFSKGFIFYNEANNSAESKENDWELLRQREVKIGESFYNAFIKDIQDTKITISKGIEILQKMAEAERLKEERYLKQVYPDAEFSTEENSYIKTVNEIYTGEEKFRKILDRIVNNIEANEKIEKENKKIRAENKKLDKDKQKKTLPSVRAPSLITTYLDYFASAYRDWIEQSIVDGNDLFFTIDYDYWMAGVNTAMNVAFDKMVNSEDSKNTAIFGSGEDYEELADLMYNNTFFRQFLYNALKINIFKKEFRNVYDKNKAASYKKKYKKMLATQRPKHELLTIDAVKGILAYDEKNKIGLNENKKRKFSGFVLEYCDEALQRTANEAAGLQVYGEKGLGASISNKNATDITLLVAKARVNLEEVATDIYNSMEGESQSDIAWKLRDFYKKWGKRKTFFVVNTSDKLYTLKQDTIFHKRANVSDLFNVFKYNFTATKGGTLGGVSVIGTKKYPYANLLDVQSEYGWFTNTADIHRIIGFLYNTVSGAFLDSKQNEVIENLRQTLASAAASLLFSDYYEVGQINDKANAIHLINLDNVYIPLSVIIKGLATAYAKNMDYTRYLNLSNFKIGKNNEILYPKNREPRYGDYTEMKGNKVSKSVEGTSMISQAFLKQREDVQKNSTFTLSFVNNFKSVIDEIIKSYKY